MIVDRASSVRKTLLSTLFDRPRPINRRSFESAKDLLFPGEATFRSFLASDNNEELVRHAKQILLRLVYANRLAPPSKLLLNLLDFERWRQGNSSASNDSYVAQDHFVHLVHLYLLGVYLFSYHYNIHKSCTTQLNKVKRSFAAQGRPDDGAEAAGNNYEAFGKTWSLFVLYHDLGYPLEGVKPAERSSHKQWLEPFSHLPQLISEDLAIKTLSVLLSIHSLIDDPTAVLLTEAYLEDVRKIIPDQRSISSDSPTWLKIADTGKPLGGTSLSKLKSTLGAASHLPRISHTEVDLLSYIFDPQSVVAVLEDTSIGMPILLVTKSDFGPLLWLTEERNVPNILKRLTPEAIRSEAFTPRYLNIRHPHWEWNYFVRSPAGQLNAFISQFLPSNGDDFFLLSRRMRERDTLKPVALMSKKRVGDLSFSFFRELWGLYAASSLSPKPKDDLGELFERLERSFSTVSRQVPVAMGSIVEEYFKKVGESGTDFYQVLANQSNEDAFGDLTKILVKGKAAIEKRLAEVLGPKLGDEIQFERAWRNTISPLENILSELAVQANVPNLSLESDSSAEKLVGFISPLTTDIDNQLSKLKLGVLSALVKNYCPSFARSRESGYPKGTFVDHGIASFSILSAMSNFFVKCIDEMQSHFGDGAKKDESLDSGALRIALCISTSRALNVLRLELDGFSREVALAILLHNLYPDGLPEGQRSYKTSFEQSPFAYLAMLADGLQIWDREKQLNQARGELPIATYGTRFDVRVDGDAIRISVWGRDLDIKTEQKKLSDALRTYLADADKLIRLQLAQT